MEEIRRQRIDRIIDMEWEMFHNVNGEERAFCQDDREGFDGFRSSQYMCWSDKALESYEKDLMAVRDRGGNIAREKYIRMMKTTDPEGYKAFERELPPCSEKKTKLVDRIWAHALLQTQKMRREFPLVSMAGRPLLASEETDGDTSIETYQKCELMTYSEETLEALLEHIENLENRGIEMFRVIQENTLISRGFTSMAQAEELLKSRRR